MVTVNGKSYASADFLNGGHAEDVTAGTGEVLPRFLAAIADTLADTSRARKTTSATSKSAAQSGSQSWVLAEDISFGVGSFFTAASRSTPGARYLCVTTGYVSATKTLTGTVILGEGSGGPYTDWDVMVSGPQGSTGPVRERNRVINGTFAVAERPVGSTDNSYATDRWRLLLEAANAAAYSQDTADTPTRAKYAAKLTVGSGEDNKFGLFQHIIGKEMWDLRGQNVSVRVPLKATAGISDVRIGILQWTGTEDAITGDPISAWNGAGTNPTLAAGWAFANTPSNLNVTTSWADYVVENVAISASATNLGLLIWCDDESTTQTTDILRIGGYVWFGPGSTAPAVNPPAYAEELAACAMYYQKLGGAANFMLTGGHCNATTTAQIALRFPRMVKAPAASASSSTAVTVNSGAGVAAATGISFSNVTALSALMTVTTSGLTAGDGAIAYVPNSGDYIALDAE
jgi:hypothetical protein